MENEEKFYMKPINVLLFYFVSGLFSVSGLGFDKFSEDAWSQVSSIYKAIENHPFNQELKTGALPSDKFLYYSRQDRIYLQAFAKALAVLATRLEDSKDAKPVLQAAIDCLDEGQSAHAKTSTAEAGGVGEPEEIGPANFAYTHFLLSTAAYKSREQLAAALLPCFWIYLKLAKALVPAVSEMNPYKPWVDTYSSHKYESAVQAMVSLVDRLAEKVTAPERQQMLRAFITASRLEWYFWEDAYQMQKWKP
jgi:thiaminase (transcriptional activator TenA)